MALNGEIRPTQNRRGLSRPRKANLHAWLNSFSSKSNYVDQEATADDRDLYRLLV